MDNYEKVINAAKNLSAYEGDGHKVTNHHSDYLNGSLYVVGFETKDGEERHNFVYIEGDLIEVCKNQALLNEFVSRKSKKTGISAAINSLVGTAGIIGLIITLTIVYLLIARSGSEIPKELWAALLAILAYYFGIKTSK